jgi:hypothetical protein
VDEGVRPVHIIFERTIGGDGIPTDTFTADHPDYVFDPVLVSVQAKGFLEVPSPLAVGSNYSAVARDNSSIPISGVTVFRNGASIGPTDVNGKVSFTA